MGDSTVETSSTGGEEEEGPTALGGPAGGGEAKVGEATIVEEAVREMVTVQEVGPECGVAYSCGDSWWEEARRE